jgi:transposase-like protein
MVIRTCEHCNYATYSKGSFDAHLKSKKHIDRISNSSNTNLNDKPHYECKHCKKTFNSRSGVWLHEKKCKLTHEVVVPADVVSQINNRLEKIEENTQNTTVMTPVTNNILNNTNNNTMNNNVNIKVEYLNKNYGNAMNIGQFVERIKFLRSDFLEIDKSRFFIDAATKILCNKIESVPREERPFHCEPPNKKYASATFFVKDNDEWRVEHQNAVEFDLRYAEFEEESDKMFMIRFFEQYSEKFYDVYLTMKQTDQLFQRIENKVNVCGQSQTHIDLMHGITDLEALKLPSTEPTPPTQIVIE